MRRTDTVCSPGVLRRLLGLEDDQALGEEPIPASKANPGRVAEWRMEANGQWRLWARSKTAAECGCVGSPTFDPECPACAPAERAEAE